MSGRNKQEERSLEQKAVVAGVKLDELPEEIREAFANDYVETLRKGKLVYSQDFYKAMVKHVKEDHMTYVEAYKACGFDVAALGKDRANAAGKRAMAMHKDGSLYRILPTDMDATVPLSRMDRSMDDAHKLAYFEARCMYLEAELEYEQEKKRLLYLENLSRLQRMMGKREKGN